MEPFVGELRIFSWQWPPKGWTPCDGRLLPIMQNQALYALLGIQYGGDGKTTFGVPDLRGRVPVQFGQSPSGTIYPMGVKGGAESVQVTVAQTPAHNHTVGADTSNGDAILAAANFLATPTAPPAAPPGTPIPNLYVTPAAAGSLAALSAIATAVTGSGQTHENRQPYITMNYCIATLGIFPPRQ